ncbi:MAG: hypothetical protein HXY19_04850 [Thermoanaerobaculaceae bacterium]|nr:hypothetical protein [Thermoanaerobaculaceae bacterium]
MRTLSAYGQALALALQRSGGSQRHAARLLGIAESTLRSKLQRHGLAAPAAG